MDTVVYPIKIIGLHLWASANLSEGECVDIGCGLAIRVREYPMDDIYCTEVYGMYTGMVLSQRVIPSDEEARVYRDIEDSLGFWEALRLGKEADELAAIDAAEEAFEDFGLALEQA